MSIARAPVLRVETRVSGATCPGMRVAEDTNPLTLGGAEEIIPIAGAAAVLKTEKYFNGKSSYVYDATN